MVEVGPGPRQYAVRMDGSKNVTLRNRKFLRTFNGVADMTADNAIPQKQPGEEGVQVRQPVRQEGADDCSTASECKRNILGTPGFQVTDYSPNSKKNVVTAQPNLNLI